MRLYFSQLAAVPLMMALIACHPAAPEHLEFERSEAWFEANPHHLNATKLAELGRLRNRIWNRHFESLTPEVRLMINEERHPFRNPKSLNDCEAFSESFRSRMKTLDYVHDVTVDAYHGGMAVLTVHLNRKMHWREYKDDIPELWNGTQVFVIHTE